MAEGRDDERISEIRARHVLYDFGMAAPESGEWIASVSCRGCHRPWPCEPAELLARIDALEAERDAIRQIVEAADVEDTVTVIRQEMAELRHWEKEIPRCQSEIEQVKAERDALASRLAAAEAALDRGRKFISQTIEAVTPEPCRCAPLEFCGECLAIKTLEQALAALAGSREQAAGEAE